MAGVEPNGKLIVDASGDAIPLLRPRLILGRRGCCDIRLDYPNVSGIHCELDFKEGRWTIRDLHSTNGVRVNGVRVTEKLLHPGDTIAIARRKYTIDYTPPVGSESLGSPAPPARS